MIVTFPQAPGVAEFDRECIRFHAEVGDSRVVCRISYEALLSRYGLPLPFDDESAQNVFTANRQAIETEVRDALQRVSKPISEVLLKSHGNDVR